MQEQRFVDDAFNQIQYNYDIAQLFDFNAPVVVSDGVNSLHGQWSASAEWYAPWKSIDGFDKDRPYEDLRLKLLQRLLADAIEAYCKRNPFKAQSFKGLLEATLQKYHNRLIDAAAVIQAMIAIKHDQESDERRAQDLGLAPDELAFYDAVATNYLNLYNEAFLRDLIHDVVQTIKHNLKVDWTQPHREDVKAAVRASVKRVLRRRSVREEDFEPFLGHILVQAEALYADWPLGEYVEVEG